MLSQELNLLLLDTVDLTAPVLAAAASDRDPDVPALLDPELLHAHASHGQ